MRHGGWLCLVVMLLAGGVHAGELSGRLRLQLGQEYDSNAVRENRADAPGDFLTRLIVQGALGYATAEQRLGLELRTGGKLFYRQTDQHQLATRLVAAYRYRPRPDRATGLRLCLHDTSQIEHTRDYLLLQAEAFGRLTLLDRLGVEAFISARRYTFKPDHQDLLQIETPAGPAPIHFSHLGPRLGLRLDLRLAASWTGWLSYAFGVHFFDQSAYRHEAAEALYAPRARDHQDLRHVAALRLRYRTRWLRELLLITQSSYSLSYNDSNSTGFSAIWHRWRAVLSLQLPLDLSLHLMGTVQLTRYPEGRNLLLDYYEPDADENENTFVARLAWRFWQELRLELQLAIYRDDFQLGSTGQPRFERETVMLGLSWGWHF